jgi:hypothetical protein
MCCTFGYPVINLIWNKQYVFFIAAFDNCTKQASLMTRLTTLSLPPSVSVPGFTVTRVLVDRGDVVAEGQSFDGLANLLHRRRPLTVPAIEEHTLDIYAGNKLQHMSNRTAQIGHLCRITTVLSYRRCIIVQCRLDIYAGKQLH